MCGICGIFSQRDGVAPVRAMMAEMVHRGPDGEGIWSSDGVTLGHRRLSIVDLSERGRQPMVTCDGGIAAVVNGEIYNYPALRRSLEEGGAVFQSDSDSEVVLHAYRAWGRKSFSRLNGMFAFALWDNGEKRLFLVRDRLGIKPLYYFEDTNGLIFASEIRALVKGTGAKRWSINPVGLGQYLAFQNTLGTESLFSGIKMVAPGEALEIDASGAKPAQYWSPSLNHKSDRAYDEVVEEFRAIFQAAIKRHLMSDVPVASYLSAGFDSTMVASHAAKQLEDPPHTFTGKFEEGGWYDEADGARLVAGHIGASITDVSIGSHDMREHFDDVIFALDEPRMGMGAFPQYLVARKAAQSHKLILTGHGGDELFSGYPVFKLAFLADAMKRNPGELFKFALKLRASELPHIAYFGLRQIAGGQNNSFLPELFSPQEQTEGLLPQVNEALTNERDTSALDELSSGSDTAFEHVLMTYLKVYLPGLLVVEDKISMAHSLESRTPFLDNDMLDLSLSITPGMKLHDGQLKAIIKRAARDVLPSALFEMPKRGFPTPLRHWLRGPLSEWMRDRICGPQSRLNRLFRREYLKKTTDSYITSWRRKIRPLDEIQTHRMWVLLSLESWLRQYEERLGVTLEMDNSAAR